MPSGAVMEEDTLYLPMDGKESDIVITITIRMCRDHNHDRPWKSRCIVIVITINYIKPWEITLQHDRDHVVITILLHRYFLIWVKSRCDHVVITTLAYVTSIYGKMLCQITICGLKSVVIVITITTAKP